MYYYNSKIKAVTRKDNKKHEENAKRQNQFLYVFGKLMSQG